MEGNDEQVEDTLRFDFKELLNQQKALEYQLNRLHTQRGDFIKALPDLTKRRVSALKKLQKEYLEVESKFYEEIHKISCKLQGRLQIIYDKRNNIINGELTPNDDDLLENDEECDTSTSVPDPPDFVDNGVPDFWLTVFKCGKLTGELIQPQDEPILQKLINVRVVMHEKEPLGFTLEFMFAPNEYFSNNVLTKTYSLKFELDKDDPFSYEGPEINKSKGCTINWFKGKNVTVKTVKKRQKHKAVQMTRIVTKSVKVSSFFNFFTPPKIPSDPDFIDEKLEEEIDFDFEIGHYMKERLIPRAALYYTGDGIEDDSSYEESDEESETDEDELEESSVYIQDENNAEANKNGGP